MKNADKDISSAGPFIQFFLGLGCILKLPFLLKHAAGHSLGLRPGKLRDHDPDKVTPPGPESAEAVQEVQSMPGCG